MGLSSRTLLGCLAGVAILACSEDVVVSTVEPSPPTPLHEEGVPGSPVFQGSVIQAETAPRPLSGGTLITVAMPNQPALAVAADTDEDAIDVVALQPAPRFIGQTLLQPGDEPGRLVADAAGRVHVVLRGGGAVATVDPTGPSLLLRRSVCSAPRGIDYDVANDTLYVVCATGEVMSLGAGGGAAVTIARIDRDLRDVVASGSPDLAIPRTLFITRFREAEVLAVDLSGHILSRNKPVVPSGTQPDVAWRAVADPAGGVRVLHQIASTTTIDVGAIPPPSDGNGNPSAPYGSGDGTNGVTSPVVSTAMTRASAQAAGTALPLMVNPAVDMAVTPDGFFEVLGLTGTVEMASDSGEGGFVLELGAMDPQTGAPDELVAIADARASAGVVVVQRRSVVPALIIVPVTTSQQVHEGPTPPPPANEPFGSVTVTLPQRASHVDTGFDLFHVPTAAAVACMNCHPEGGDDGHTWLFRVADRLRLRRTISLRGGVVENSAPYHWDGDILGMQALCDEIFTRRMGGGTVLPKQTQLLARFLQAIPRVPVYAGLDQAAASRGKALFEGSAGCNTCHAGPYGTSTYNQDIGKVDAIKQSTPMQIPMLVDVADRAPYLHDGCAATLMDRLTDPGCAGSKHGNTAQLDTAQLSDLETYLESL